MVASNIRFLYDLFISLQLRHASHCYIALLFVYFGGTVNEQLIARGVLSSENSRTTVHLFVFVC
jgi:hypothetical protein